MRYDEDRALEVRKEILEPADGLNVQMVGRLVEQKDVRLAEQRTREQHLDLLDVAEVLHLGVQNSVCVQTQTVEQLAGFGLGVPAAHLGELGFKLRRLVAVLLGERVLHVERVLLAHDSEQALVAAENGVENGFVVEREVVLLEYAHARLGRDGYRAGGRVEVARQDAQEGGLARAVRADNAVAVALREFQVYVLEQRLAAEVQTQFANIDHVKVSSI